MFLLLLLIAALPCPHPHRSRTAAREFARTHPCPGGPDRGSKLRCRGFVIDHRKPLGCCGKDSPSNMQWQTIDAAKAKDRVELRCR